MRTSKGKLTLSLLHPSHVKGILVVKRQDEVPVIRFSLTSLPTGRQACPITSKFLPESEALIKE